VGFTDEILANMFAVPKDLCGSKFELKAVLRIPNVVSRIPDPGSCFLSIPDPTTVPEEEGEKIFCVFLPFFVAANIIKF
jgi:hypothetical protein